MALIGMLKENTTLNDLDVSLNQVGLDGEIALMSLSMEQPNRDFTWRAPSVVSDWTQEECAEIIQHFGITSVSVGLKRLYSNPISP